MRIAAIDIETTGLNPNKDKILSYSILTSDGVDIAIDAALFPKQSHRASFERLNRDYEVVIAHNAKFDASFIYTNYGVLLDNLWCTMLASQIIKNGRQFSHNLLNCIIEYTGKVPMQTNKKKLMRALYMNHRYGTALSADMLEYVKEDTKYLFGIYKEQKKRIKLSGTDKVVSLENNLIPSIIKMEIHGCLVDRQGWFRLLGKWEGTRAGYMRQLDKIIKELSTSVPEVSGGKFTRERNTETIYQGSLFGASQRIKADSSAMTNFSSSAQITDLVKRLDDIEMESVDEDSIKIFLTEHPKAKSAPFLDKLLKYREYDKLLSTYGDKFLRKLDGNNHIHTVYSQCRTKTGRLASSSPNLQNIPGRGAGGEVRDFFIARPGYKMVTCDMAGAEITLAADFSEEPLLLSALQDGTDMHSDLASTTFSIIFNQDVKVSKSSDPIKVHHWEFIPVKLRDAHKSVTFAKFYKAGAGRIYQVLAKYINMASLPSQRIGVASKISKALDARMPVLSKYLDEKIKEAQKHGILRGALGRTRYFDGEVYGSAANFPIQNANAEAMKMAIIKVDQYLTKTGHGRLVMNIHDEVVCEVRDEYLTEASEKIKEILAWSLSFFLTKLKGGADYTIDKAWKK